MSNERLNANFYVKDTFVKTNGCDSDLRCCFKGKQTDFKMLF